MDRENIYRCYQPYLTNRYSLVWIYTPGICSISLLLPLFRDGAPHLLIPTDIMSIICDDNGNDTLSPPALTMRGYTEG